MRASRPGAPDDPAGTLSPFGDPTSRRSPALKKIVLAYSGGLDTSVAVAWLREQYDAEVVTLTVDVGGGSLRPGVGERALSAGATRAYVVDARQTFVEDFVWPAVRAGAVYQGAYPLATALARPLIAQLLVEVAQRRARTRLPTAAPARATTRSASTSRSRPSTAASRSSRRCASAWA